LIKSSDVAIERRAKSLVAGDGLMPDQAIGLAAKNPLRAGQILKQSDAVKPLAVQRNEPVTIFYETPGIMLTVRGKATESGSVGDVITVLNVQSNRTIHATINGPGRVTVAAMLPMVAAATSPAADPTPVNTQ
jgi:flagellar basal body P-ring formation protein FlgA